MKADIHPSDYRPVVFQDLNNNESFLIKSTARTKETVKHKDGQTYPLIKLHITSASHPFYTGLEKMIDIEGRIDKFRSRRKAAEKAQSQLKAKSLKTLKNAPSVQEKTTPKKAPISKIQKTKPKKSDASEKQTTQNDLKQAASKQEEASEKA